MRPDDLLSRMRPVTLADQPLFAAYLQKFPQRVCEMTFSNFFLWGESRAHLFCEHDGHLLVSFQKRAGDRQWYPPIGPDPATIIRSLPPSDGFRWQYIDEPVAKQLEDLTPVATPDTFDYIYSVQELRELKGTKFMKKRTYVHKVERLNPEVFLLGSTDFDECHALQQKWVEEYPKPVPVSVHDEVSAMDLAMKNFEQLNLFGVGVRIGGKLVALAIGGPVNETMFLEGFEKADHEHPGLHQFILHEFVMKLPAQYTELNREEDMGLETLKKTKEQWNPTALINKFQLL